MEKKENKNKKEQIAEIIIVLVTMLILSFMFFYLVEKEYEDSDASYNVKVKLLEVQVDGNTILKVKGNLWVDECKDGRQIKVSVKDNNGKIIKHYVGGSNKANFTYYIVDLGEVKSEDYNYYLEYKKEENKCEGKE